MDYQIDEDEGGARMLGLAVVMVLCSVFALGTGLLLGAKIERAHHRKLTTFCIPK